MATFQYTAQSPDGANTRGVVEAPDEYAAVQQIREHYPIITSIQKVDKRNENFFTKQRFKRKISEKALSIMCSQIAITLRSGVPIARCLDMIGRQTEDPQLRQILIDSAEDVEQGGGVASSLARNGPSLPATFIEMVRAGETSGTIEHSFEVMENFFDKSYKNAEKLKRVMIYPAFVIVLAIIVIIIVMAKVIPTIAATFADLGGNMPTITKMMIAMSNFFAKWWVLIILAIFAAVIGVRLWSQSDSGHEKWNEWLLKAPIIGKINMMSGAARFANTMAVLMQAGLPVDRAVQTTAKTLDNFCQSQDIMGMVGRIQQGISLAKCMETCSHFPETLVEMVAVGEETGEIDETMQTIGAFYDNEADNATQIAISRLEPTILVALAIFAGFIVISIYLPIFTMYDLM